MILAVFGGSFNPPHIAHVLACAVLLSLEDVDRILVVPTFKHPFAKSLVSFEDRVAMCELAMGWIPRVEVSRIEEQIGGESLTLRTLEHLSFAHPDCSLRLVIGADIVADSPRWFAFDTVIKLAPPIVLGRAGVTTAGARMTLLPDVSSTQVRAAIARGAWDELSSLVPRRVLTYVRERGLYGAPD